MPSRRREMFQTGWLEELNKSVEKAIKEVNLNIRQSKVRMDAKPTFWQKFFNDKSRRRSNAKENAR